MSENSKISWTDSTHNFWRGCTRVSVGCQNCYAEKLVTTRLGGEWGPNGVRVRSKDFEAPLRWNKKPWVCDGCGYATADSKESPGSGYYHCIKCGRKSYPVPPFHRRRVFSLSLGDWLEGEPQGWRGPVETHPIGGIPVSWLADMLDAVRRCDQLQWILCTKRPENFKERLNAAIDRDRHGVSKLHDWLVPWVAGMSIPPNITLLASVENQEMADERIPHLLRIPAARRGLSCEPLLGQVDLTGKLNWGGKLLRPILFDISWVIVGGESGPKARPCNVDWIRDIVRQCRAAGVACFVKQLGSNLNDADLSLCAKSSGRSMHHPKGADPSEWPEDLRVQQYPEGL